MYLMDQRRHDSHLRLQSMLLRAESKVNKLGKKMFIVNPQPQVSDVFDLIGLTNVVNTIGSVEEAVSQVN